MAGLLPILLIFAVMWLLLIRPQQRRVRQHQQLVASIQSGDEVVTAGGIVGTVTALDDETLLLQVAPGVELRVLRGAVSRRMGDDLVPEMDGDDEVEEELPELEDDRGGVIEPEPSPPAPEDRPEPPAATNPPAQPAPPPAPQEPQTQPERPAGSPGELP